MHLLLCRPAARAVRHTPIFYRNTRFLSPKLPSSAPRAPFTTDGWSPPSEPDRPTIPYRDGFTFSAERVKPPPPFLKSYSRILSGSFSEFLKSSPLPSRQFLRNTTLTEYCISMASKPLPCDELGKNSSFQVLDEITVGEGLGRGSGPQVFTCKKQGQDSLFVAKVYDPLYYPFATDDFPDIPIDPVARAEHAFALETAAYIQLVGRHSSDLTPKFHGAWILYLPLKHVHRPVGFILLEHVEGMPLNTLNPQEYTTEQRLAVLALAMEIDVELHFAGVIHNDLAARNIICPGNDFLANDFRVKMIDFDKATVFSALKGQAPCESESLPQSHIEAFWNGQPNEMQEWLPDGWYNDNKKWNQWLLSRWGNSSRYRQVPDNVARI